MFRVLEDINAKNADAMYSAGSAMTIGMGVVKGANFEADFPSEATATDVFFVTKEIIPTGLDSLKGEISDYALEAIVDGEKVVLVKPIIGEIYWTDQFDSGITKGNYVVVGTDGKFEKAASSAKSNLKVVSTDIKDAGTHAGIAIEVVDWATVSA